MATGSRRLSKDVQQGSSSGDPQPVSVQCLVLAQVVAGEGIISGLSFRKQDVKS